MVSPRSSNLLFPHRDLDPSPLGIRAPSSKHSNPNGRPFIHPGQGRCICGTVRRLHAGVSHISTAQQSPRGTRQPTPPHAATSAKRRWIWRLHETHRGLISLSFSIRAELWPRCPKESPLAGCQPTAPLGDMPAGGKQKAFQFESGNIMETQNNLSPFSLRYPLWPGIDPISNDSESTQWKAGSPSTV